MRSIQDATTIQSAIFQREKLITSLEQRNLAEFAQYLQKEWFCDDWFESWLYCTRLRK